MPNCSVIGCGVKRSRSQNITLHQLPTNKSKQKIWLDIIGVENLNTSTKTIHICSLHFEESCFNRTLNKVTLRDDVLPSRNLLPLTRKVSGISTQIDQNQTASSTDCLASNMIEILCVPVKEEPPEEVSTRSGIYLAPNNPAMPDLAPNTAYILDVSSSTSAAPGLSVHTFNIIKKLKKRCQEQAKKIKRLNEKVRRQKKKIAHFSNIIKDLKQDLKPS